MKRNTSPEAYYERLKNLAEVNKTSLRETKTSSLGTLIDYKRAADGTAYGIIKENHNYYLKKAGLKNDPDVSDFIYIGGLENITDFQFKSIAEAQKQRNMVFQSINETLSFKPLKTSKTRLNEDKVGQEIDQALNKVDDLDAATSAAETSPEIPTEPSAELPVDGIESLPEPTPETGESPEHEAGETPDEENAEHETGEEVPDEEMSTEPEVGTGEDKDITTKEIEKSLGKLTNKLRGTELTDSQVKSYVNSFLSAFKDKFKDVEIEDRKTMANKILKVVPDEDIENLSNDVPQDDVQEAQCSECGGFTQYAEARGYNSNSIQECDDEEMSSLISGYANAHNDGQNDGDLEVVAIFVTPEIAEKLKGDYGHDEYAEKLTPYTDQMTESAKKNKQEKINELNWSGNDTGNIEVQPNVMKEDNEEEIEPEEIIPDEDVEIEPETNDVSFAPASQSLGVAAIGTQNTSAVDVNVDAQNKTVNVTMNENKNKTIKKEKNMENLSESEIKVRNYIRKHLEEVLGIRKASLNESKKSEKLKRFDAIIEEQYRLYESNQKNKVNEVFGMSIKEKFAKLNPNDVNGVNGLFQAAFREILNNPKMGIISAQAKKSPVNIKYDILKQYVQNNGGTLRLSPKGGVQYASKDVLNKSLENPFGGGGTGGGNFSYGGATGT